MQPNNQLAKEVKVKLLRKEFSTLGLKGDSVFSGD